MLVGCAAKHTLVGEWTGVVSAEGTKVDMVVSFGSDGVMTMRQTAEGRTETQVGTYTLDGDALTFTPTSLEAPGLSEEQAEAIRSAMAKNPKPLVFRVRWDGDHSIVLTPRASQPASATELRLKRKR